MEDLDGEWQDAVVVGRDEVLEFDEETILPQPPETIAKIRAWLKATEYDGEGSEYRKHVSSHTSGTGSWFLASDTYQEWHRSDEHGMLWARGSLYHGHCARYSSDV